MLFIVGLLGYILANSIQPSTNCGTLNGHFGTSVRCPYNKGYVVGFCSSGSYLDCNNGHSSHQYKCCDEHEVSIDTNRCEVQYGNFGFVYLR